ncbi:protein of unknown function (plasmid) [Thermococcus nautili]|uniref:hypothetical protein n=1 Tax=Thermococcus nautili TaxID=195522 RepID=UPI002552894F|nr:hypothetical protein [Thermococcus nautili]CAI1494263.1 protein of unknown function [Thermococcus nautili]
MRVKFIIPEEVFKRKKNAKYTINGKEMTAKAGIFIENGDGTYSWIFDHICYSGKSEECSGIPPILDARLKESEGVYWKYSRRYEDFVMKKTVAYRSNLKLKRLFLKALDLLKKNANVVKVIIEPSNYESEFLRAFEVALFVGALGIENLPIETPVEFRKYLPFVRNFRNAINLFIDPDAPGLYLIDEVLDRDVYKTSELFTVRLKMYYRYSKTKFEGAVKKALLGWDSKAGVMVAFPYSARRPSAKVIYSLLNREDRGHYPELYGRNRPSFREVTPKGNYIYSLKSQRVIISDVPRYVAIFERKVDFPGGGYSETIELTVETGFKLIPTTKGFILKKGEKIIGEVYTMEVSPELTAERFVELMEKGLIELDTGKSIRSDDIRFGLEVITAELNGKPVRAGIGSYLKTLQVLGTVKPGDVISVKHYTGEEFRFLVIAVGKEGGVALDLDNYRSVAKSYNRDSPYWDLIGDILLYSQ